MGAIGAIINRFCFSRRQIDRVPYLVFIAGSARVSRISHAAHPGRALPRLRLADRHRLSIKRRRAPLTVSTPVSAFVNRLPCKLVVFIDQREWNRPWRGLSFRPNDDQITRKCARMYRCLLVLGKQFLIVRMYRVGN